MNESNDCIICQGVIEEHATPDGKVYWSEGHNAQPVKDGRCCDMCNTLVVLPARIKAMLGANNEKT